MLPNRMRKVKAMKFDYRYNDEPWGNAKDSPERAINFLCSDTEYVVPKRKP